MQTSIAAAARRHGDTPIHQKFWVVWRPFFTVNEERSKAWAWLCLMLVLLMLESGILVSFSYTQKDFSTAMSDKDRDGFYRGTRRYMAILLAAAPLFAFSRFVQGKLGLDWRRWLTEHMCGLYFDNRAFYALKIGDLSGMDDSGASDAGGLERVKGEEQGGGIDNPVSAVDNPDQRIGEDINSFTTNCISVLVVFVGSVLKIGSFIGVLLSISPRLTAFVLLYSVGGTLSTTFMFGARLKHLIFEEAKREANFRFGLVRVREHAEEIAFYRGEKGEEEGTKGLLERVVDNVHKKLWCEAQLAVFSNSFMWLTAVLPYLVVAERYFSGEIEFGVIAQTAMAFRVIQNALSIIVTKIRTLASMASEVDRLHFLLMCMETMIPPTVEEDSDVGDDGYVEILREDESEVSSTVHDDGVGGRLHRTGEGGKSSPQNFGRISTKMLLKDDVKHSETVLEMEDVTLLTPNRKELICRRLSFQVSKGQSVLIVGPSGCGKSSLLRAISGLWSAGDGSVRRYPDDRTIYIPQKPYLTLGSLRAQMVYPRPAHDLSTSPALLETVLEHVQLDYLSKRSGGLETTRDWQDELSLGEQQRLAFSRLLTNTPSMVYLDEATSALDEANEAKMYGMVQTIGVDAYVSVGHRASLFRYHTHVLRAKGDGQWSFHTMGEFLEKYNKSER